MSNHCAMICFQKVGLMGGNFASVKKFIFFIWSYLEAMKYFIEEDFGKDYCMCYMILSIFVIVLMKLLIICIV